MILPYSCKHSTGDSCQIPAKQNTKKSAKTTIFPVDVFQFNDIFLPKSEKIKTFPALSPCKNTCTDHLSNCCHSHYSCHGLSAPHLFGIARVFQTQGKVLKWSVTSSIADYKLITSYKYDLKIEELN